MYDLQHILFFVARSVSCTGDSQHTECTLQCIQNYVAVEQARYMCRTQPCRAWTTEGRQCYICDQNCTQFAGLADPAPADLLGALSCDRDCDQIVVSSEGKRREEQERL